MAHGHQQVGFGGARPVTLRSWLAYVRFGVAALCAVALVARYVWGLGSVTFTPGNFFAYLTIQSNIAYVAVLVISGLVAMRLDADPPWLSTLRATVLGATVSSGIVFALIVQQAGARGLRIDVPWSDQILHFWLPALAIIDWLFAPGRGRAMWRAVLFLLGFTLAWGGFTLIRGAVVGWYPYFFLDPDQLANAAEFFVYGAVALAMFGGVATGLVALSRIHPLGDMVGRLGRRIGRFAMRVGRRIRQSRTARVKR